MVRLVSLLLFFIALNASGFEMVLESKSISAEEQSKARNIRDSTDAPTSFVGGMAKKMFTCEGSGCKNNSVLVKADVTCALCATNIKLSLSPADTKSSANFSGNGSSSYVSILDGYSGQTIFGRYNYLITWKDGGATKSCSGVIPVTGAKKNFSLNVYQDCKSYFSEF